MNPHNGMQDRCVATATRLEFQLGIPNNFLIPCEMIPVRLSAFDKNVGLAAFRARAVGPKT